MCTHPCRDAGAEKEARPGVVVGRPRWTPQNRPYVDGAKPAIGRAPKPREVLAYSEWLRKSVQRRPMGIADGRPRQTPAPSNTIWPFWGDTEIAAPLVRVDPRAPCGPRSLATAGAGRLTRRAARLEAGCASFWGRRSGRGHGGAADQAARRRRRCRPGACPSLPRGDST